MSLLLNLFWHTCTAMTTLCCCKLVASNLYLLHIGYSSFSNWWMFGGKTRVHLSTTHKLCYVCLLDAAIALISCCAVCILLFFAQYSFVKVFNKKCSTKVTYLWQEWLVSIFCSTEFKIQCSGISIISDFLFIQLKFLFTTKKPEKLPLTTLLNWKPSNDIEFSEDKSLEFGKGFASVTILFQSVLFWG